MRARVRAYVRRRSAASAGAKKRQRFRPAIFVDHEYEVSRIVRVSAREYDVQHVQTATQSAVSCIRTYRRDEEV